VTAIEVDDKLLAIQSWAATGSARQTLQTKQENVMTQHTPLLSETQSADAMLRARARLVVPGGMWGHLNAARLPDGYPQFFASAGGCRVRDVDGREYIDFMYSWGPILLGHRHPEVQAAAGRKPSGETASTVRVRSWWNSPKISSPCCRMPIGRCFKERR
jgi:4-aminobutyrate aminotransferase-like enzyme